MRIALITELFHPDIGGVQNRLKNFGSQWASNGHEVDVYAIRTRPDLPAQERIAGLRVLRIHDCFRYLDSVWGRRNLPAIFGFTRALLRRRATLRQYDLIVFGMFPLLPQIFLPRLLKVAMVMEWCEIRDGWFWRTLYRMLASRRLRYLCSTEEASTYLRDVLAVPEADTLCMSCAVDATLLQTPEQARTGRRVVFVGRMQPHKHPDLVLDAFAAGQLGQAGVTLHLIGTGPMLDSLRQRAADMVGVTVHGYLDDAEVVEHMQQATLLVLPSEREGFGIVIAEAAALGTPTLTTDYPQNSAKDVVSRHGFGWIVAPEPQSIAAALLRHSDSGNAEWRQAAGKARVFARTECDPVDQARRLLEFGLRLEPRLGLAS